MNTKDNEYNETQQRLRQHRIAQCVLAIGYKPNRMSFEMFYNLSFEEQYTVCTPTLATQAVVEHAEIYPACFEFNKKLSDFLPAAYSLRLKAWNNARLMVAARDANLERMESAISNCAHKTGEAVLFGADDFELAIACLAWTEHAAPPDYSFCDVFLKYATNKTISLSIQYAWGNIFVKRHQCLCVCDDDGNVTTAIREDNKNLAVDTKQAQMQTEAVFPVTDDAHRPLYAKLWSLFQKK